jgi:uncharacterized protein (TIGR00255 family)
MRSMTGFGIGHAQFGAGRLCLELRSLNHKFLDVRVKVPSDLTDLSSYLEHLARTHLVRGRYDIQLRTEGQTAPQLRIDEARVTQLYRQLCVLRDAVAPEQSVDLSALLGLPGLYVDADEHRSELAREAIAAAFSEARRRLDEMRDLEGAHLASELDQMLDRAIQLTADCAARASGSISAHRTRLHERVRRLIDDPAYVVDPQRLEQELAIIADRSDVTEELARLTSHFAQFKSLIAAQQPSGRRMDFLLQEIARETNTLGAKSQDATLSHLVVELKAEAERMREQVQNVE